MKDVLTKEYIGQYIFAERPRDTPVGRVAGCVAGSVAGCATGWVTGYVAGFVAGCVIHHVSRETVYGLLAVLSRDEAWKHSSAAPRLLKNPGTRVPRET